MDGEVRRDREAAYGRPAFLLGKLLNALLLDPTAYDLKVLEMLNRVREAMEQTLTDDQLAAVDQVTREGRGAAYQRVQTLLFEPSRDLGELAGHYLDECAHRSFTHRTLAQLADLGRSWEADLASFLLLDGEFCDRLITLGRDDARQRSEEVLEFLTAPPEGW